MEKYSIIMPVYKKKSQAKRIISRFRSAEIEELTDFNIVIDEEDLETDWDKCQIIKNKKRVGKPKAINQGLKASQEDIKILISCDIDIDPSTATKMAREISDDYDLVVPRIEPKTDEKTCSKIAQTIWKLHHYISVINPKAGEAIGFRGVPDIPEETVADEEYISSQKNRKKYLSSEIIYNQPPRSLKQLYFQRRRIFTGHLDLQRKRKYVSPTNNVSTLLRVVVTHLNTGGNPDILLKAAILEFFARIDGFLRALMFQIPWKWKIVDTTR